MSYFDRLDMLPEDPILKLSPECQADPRPDKMNLGVGIYQDAEGKAFVLSSVRQAEVLLLEEQGGKGYQPIAGTPLFAQRTQELLFGLESPPLVEKRLFTLQALGGSGALRIGAEFLAEAGYGEIYLSAPTWPNHEQLLGYGGLRVDYYPYYNGQLHSVNFPTLCAFMLRSAPGSIFLLQPSCHNPSGCDLTDQQWKELSFLMKKQRLIPFFDIAYQGFSRDLESDASAIRIFAADGHEMVVASSYSKNMGLYGERVGALTIVAGDSANAARCGSHAKAIIRRSYSSPPIHGGALVVKLLDTPHLRMEWVEELARMCARLKELRRMLAEGLAAHGQECRFLEEQAGLFCLLGLDSEQVRLLKEQHGIYMPDSGRINIAGLNDANVGRFVDAILSVHQPTHR